MGKCRTFGRSGTCAAFLAAVLASPCAAQTSEAPDSADASAEPVACLSHPMIRRTKILDDRNIVFFTRTEEIYNNQLPKACPTLRRNSLVNFAVTNKRQCAGDDFQILWETSPGNYTPTFVCELGAFIPISETVLEELTTMTEPDRGRRSQRRRSPREAVTTEQVELPSATDPAAPAPSSEPAAPEPGPGQ